VRDAVVDPGPAQVRVERVVIRLAAFGVRRDLLRAAVAATVRVDRNHLDLGCGGSAQHDRGAPAKAADLDNLPRPGDSLRRLGEP
jgi:hypothetical protein